MSPERQKITAEALSWIGTPRRIGQCVKGAGIDCVKLLLETLANSGAVSRQAVDELYREFGVYHDDWFLHTSEQRYMLALMRLAKKVCETQCYAAQKIEPGNLVAVKCATGRIWNHGGIVIEWPFIVHCVLPKVVKIDASRDPMWAHKEIDVFSPIPE